MKFAIIASVAVIGWSMSACLAQSPGGVDLRAVATESEPSARAALETFGKLVTDENARTMGFTSPGDVARAQLGSPLVDFMIGLDAIRNYQQEQDPLGLLMPTGEVVYPVGDGGNITASVTLKKQNNEWQAVSFGSPVRSQAVGSVRQNVVQSEDIPIVDSFQVRVPAYNLFFVGYIEGEKLMLTPAMDFAQFDLRAGATLPAEEILLRLQPVAERDEGLPR